ncbi:hypothetical protein C8F04DRAFT_1067120 [Mycena alexandri]|uniref:F-box domain-containing protein n=1 Tax=Mycena alexandri TaxID=1745969 RepID=A0AAD6XE38_9AGAR|nr:hypothetical protein C8F04DRAFT_1067120 [Mycena alexandri]
MSLEVLIPGHENPATLSRVNFNRSLDLLLTSNNPPLDSDIPSIRAIIWDGETQVDALNEQIHNLQPTLAGLVQRRDRAAEHVRQHRAIVSPVRRLPPELLCEIFALSFNDKGPPWHLGHICRSWRHTALSYPPLWSSIAISSTSSLENMTSIQAQLLRSANAPLDIYWGNDGPIDHDAHSSWSDLVLPYSRRWRTLHIHNFQSRVGGLDWLRPVKDRLDQLKELITTSCYGADMPDVFTTAPNLRRAILTDAEFSNNSRAISMPWGQITHYRGAYPLGRQMEILSAAQNLLFCDINFFNETSLDPTTPIILPRLRGLSLQMAFFLSQLTTPVLETLVLHDPGSLYLSVLPPFIQRSSCTLNKLVLKQCVLDPGLIATLRDLPALVYLLLEHIPNELFKAMSLTGASSDLCPKLITIVYGYWDIPSMPQEDFFTMARSRFQSNPGGASRLGSLRLYDSSNEPVRPPPADLMAQIAMLCADGFDTALLDRREAASLLGPLA